MFNPSKAAEEIKKQYIGYISTTFHFRNQKLQNKLVNELERIVSNGPFVEIKDSFKSGKSINELINDNLLTPLYRELEKNKNYPPKLPIERPLYLHQEKAIEKIVAGKNVVVSTGTGSGKTNCFIIPVINELLKEKEKGELNDGVRAIFIYPMNALANDQIKGLREILMAYPEIRFGVYNGGTENREDDAIALYDVMNANEKYTELRQRLPNELLSRDEMKKRPPHILFTNYAMLEHMLLRPGDDVIFSNSNFKFVVLDEAHVYAGATGIETSFLMGRLKGRIKGEKEPQFILTSATLGDGSKESNSRVVEFAERLTGCKFNEDDIITAYRVDSIQSNSIENYSIQLFTDLANEENFFDDVIKKYDLQFENTNDEKEKKLQILYDIISSSLLYNNLRKLGSLITLTNFAKNLNITKEDAVSFISLCANARKKGKPLLDIRYHYFLKALDGCYLALDYEDSLSLTRKDNFIQNDLNAKMFEIAVCEDCGEFAIVGKQVQSSEDDNNNILVRAGMWDERNFYQIAQNIDIFEDDETELTKQNQNQNINQNSNNNFYLCKSCGAIVPEGQEHNKWCTCGNTQQIKLNKNKINKQNKANCLNCNGTLRHFNLGYDAATGVIATSLFEQIPATKFEYEANKTNQPTNNPFLQYIENEKSKTKTQIQTGSQFLIFSDSRQGAAKFACFLGDSYKEFLRRRGIWNIVNECEGKYHTGINFSDLVSLLDNFYSTNNLFRNNNAPPNPNNKTSIIESKRQAWIAALNELHNSSRSTSLVSLGKISFEYLGNSDRIINAIAEKYNLTQDHAKNFLNYLAFEIVKSGAIITDSDSDINSSDREYLFFTKFQKFITKFKNGNVTNSQGFVPSTRPKNNGIIKYYRSNKLIITKKTLNLDDTQAVEFLDNYWNYLIYDQNDFKLDTKDGKGYYIPAKKFKVNLGKNALLWKCNNCGKVTQFNISNSCIQINCNGSLDKLDSEAYCKNNHYASLYNNNKIIPLFVKEHTAQLAKKEALDYQQQFIRKEINALSCSTTFEMGVDVGDLETVFLRNIPPLASNYAQRVGRAGRSIDAAAFALTFARLSSHDFTFFDNPVEMINGVIYPPNFSLDNEKILKRHIYAIAISLYLKNNEKMYSKNNAIEFINNKGYQQFFNWLNTHPHELKELLNLSILISNQYLTQKYLKTFDWLEEFIGENGILSKLIKEFELNVEYLEKELKKAKKEGDGNTITLFENKLKRYQKNDLIDFLVRGNILPKYGFPIDSVELTQNIASRNFKSLNLSRDLSIAIAEYAPSSEVIADGGLYTSRYIRKPIVNKNEMSDFETAYISTCNTCNHINYSKMPVANNGILCAICNNNLNKRDFQISIEPRAGFVAEEEIKSVPLSSQERKYKTEAIYIGDKEANLLNKFQYDFKNGNEKTNIEVESTTNDSLVIKSTEAFYVCSKCGYSIAGDETAKLSEYKDYRQGANKINQNNAGHKNPFGKGLCACNTLNKYSLHHEFKTDVAKITFDCDTSGYSTMLSVMYALLSSFANELSIERRDIKACLSYKMSSGHTSHKIIIYDAVPGGAGHSRRLVTEDGRVLKAVIKRAINILDTCECSPSCYRCLRNYENQKVHEELDRINALEFLNNLIM